MNVTETLVEAGVLMFIGMVVVFAFLTMLIFATKLLTKIALALPEQETATPAPRKIAPTVSGQPSPQVVAAIGAAVKQYRKKNN